MKTTRKPKRKPSGAKLRALESDRRRLTVEQRLETVEMILKSVSQRTGEVEKLAAWCREALVSPMTRAEVGPPRGTGFVFGASETCKCGVVGTSHYCYLLGHTWVSAKRG